MARRRKKGEERAIAHERVERLVALAEEALRAGRVQRALRYGQLAWAVKTRYQLTGTAADAALCRRCRAFSGPGTSRVRFHGGKRTVTCLVCGHVRRRPLHGPVRPSPAALSRGEAEREA